MNIFKQMESSPENVIIFVYQDVCFISGISICWCHGLKEK